MSDNQAPKDYSLSELESWVWDALENGCTSEQIYDSIKSTVLKSLKFHESCYKGSKELFNLLSQRPYFEVVDGSDVGIGYGNTAYTYNPEDFKLDSPALHDVDIEGMKIHATSGYNDGWTQAHYRKELLERGWTMTADGFWIKEEKKDIDSDEV